MEAVHSNKQVNPAKLPGDPLVDHQSRYKVINTRSMTAQSPLNTPIPSSDYQKAVPEKLSNKAVAWRVLSTMQSVFRYAGVTLAALPALFSCFTLVFFAIALFTLIFIVLPYSFITGTAIVWGNVLFFATAYLSPVALTLLCATPLLVSESALFPFAKWHADSDAVNKQTLQKHILSEYHYMDQRLNLLKKMAKNIDLSIYAKMREEWETLCTTVKEIEGLREDAENKIASILNDNPIDMNNLKQPTVLREKLTEAAKPLLEKMEQCKESAENLFENLKIKLLPLGYPVEKYEDQWSKLRTDYFQTRVKYPKPLRRWELELPF